MKSVTYIILAAVLVYFLSSYGAVSLEKYSDSQGGGTYAGSPSAGNNNLPPAKSPVVIYWDLLLQFALAYFGSKFGYNKIGSFVKSLSNNVAGGK